MLPGLKAIFAPKSAVGLQVRGSFLAAVQVSNPQYSPLVDKIAYQEVKDPERVVNDLEALFQREGFNPEVLVTSLPTSEATIREIRVDFRNYRKLGKIIKYQMEPHVPYPIEDMVVDFFPPQQDGSILTMGIRKEALSGHLTALSEIHLVPRVVSLEDVALFSLFVRTASDPAHEAVAILHASGPRRVVQVVRRKRLEFIRVLPGGRDLGAMLQETLGIYAMKNQAPVKEILITGGSALEEPTPEWITERTGIPASLWRPFEQVRHGLGNVPQEVQSLMSVPLGLALSVSNGGPRKFNLRKEEFAFKESFNLSSLLIYMVCALVLFVGLFTFQLHRKVSIQEEAYNGLNTQIRQVLAETFPGTASIVKGKETAQMAQRISAETAQYQWIYEITGEISILDTLLLLTQRMSGYGDVQVDNLSLEAGKINLDGRASSFETVDSLKGRLGETGTFRNVKLVSAKMDSREQAVLFNFVLEKSK